MAFFKRNEEKKFDLPELPGMTASSRLPEFPELPPLPEAPKTEEHEFLKPLPSFSMRPLPTFKSEPIRNPAIGERKSIDVSEILKSKELNREPVFVKLDKFKDAIEKFEDIKAHVSEIDNSLKKLREIKDKEEHELASWEEEVKSIKEKVASIDNSLFSKI